MIAAKYDMEERWKLVGLASGPAFEAKQEEKTEDGVELEGLYYSIQDPVA